VSEIRLDGGEAIPQGLSEDVVDQMTLSWISAILVSGRPLFADGLPESQWRLARSQSFPSGLVQTIYQRG
jgi:dihydrofolate reductase